MATAIAATPPPVDNQPPQNIAYEKMYADTAVIDERKKAYENKKKEIDKLVEKRCKGKSPEAVEILKGVLTGHYDETLHQLQRSYEDATNFRDDELRKLAAKVEFKPLGKPLRVVMRSSVKDFAEMDGESQQKYARAVLEPFKAMLVKLGYNAKVTSAGQENYALHCDIYTWAFDAACKLHRSYTEDFAAIKALESDVNLKILYPTVDWDNPAFAEFLNRVNDMSFDLTKIGTPECPLRASSLPKLLACDWRSVLIFSREFEDVVGKAANSGSAVHKAIDLFHQGKSYDEAMDGAKLGLGEYPLADLDEVRLHFRPYTEDSRNRFTKDSGGLIASEEKFQVTIPEKIETGEEISLTFQGTFDQIRLDSSMKILYDVKTGKSLDAYSMLMEHTLQLAIYWIGARTLGYDVEAVGIIYTQGYRTRGADLPSPQGVFLRHPMQFADTRRLLKGVFRRVRDIRAGIVNPNPGAHCNICPARSIATCLPLLSERLK